MEIAIELPNVKLGVIEADTLLTAPTSEDLAHLMDEICSRKQREFSVDTLADAEPTHAVRAMFRAWGVDPSKYRPSSEALVRRVVQGKGLYRVSSVVDIGNLGSIETGWPFGCYDRSKMRPPVRFRQGVSGESYEGIGKRTWHLEGRPVLADLDGPFGSPISDSTRTMISGSAIDILAVIYAPAPVPDASIEQAMARLAGRLAQFAGCRSARAAICR